jgi:crotonobetainyl-CoA:carnitine CoA-transferase CaiB-like acyl-CoA transferase
MTQRGRPQRALAGVRVLELGPTLASAWCGQTLGDLGADVIRIEPPAGDALRADPPAIAATCRNKRSLTLELGNAADREIFLRLARTADAVIDGYAPGTLDRLGLGFDRVRRVAPRIVYCAVTPYGQDGPYASRVADESNIAAMSGLTAALGGPTPLPLLGLPVASTLGALFAVVSLLAALQARERLGEGQRIDVSASDAAASLLAFPFAGVSGFDSSLPGCGTYTTREGQQISLAASTEARWARLCQLLGRDDLRSARQAAGADSQQRAAIDAEVAAAFVQRTRDAWLDLLADDEVGVAPVHDPVSAARDPHLVHRGVFVAAPAGGDAPAVRATSTRFPALLSATPAQVSRPAPALGQHTAELLRELGVDTPRAEDPPRG